LLTHSTGYQHHNYRKHDSQDEMSATFQLDGLEFIAFNGGPTFTFSPAVSFFVRCETQ
jgi:predicted 3-demethylubiquinone-9 3-methyltransferase (glyoxalase superfamily)